MNTPSDRIAAVRSLLRPDQGPDEVDRLYDELRAISLRSAAVLGDTTHATQADLYDENGLPA